MVSKLRTGQADLDGDGDISLDDLYRYVHDRVVDEMPQQRPKKQENVEGRIVIARNIHWQLPDYVRNAIGSPISSDRLGALEQLRRLHQSGNDRVRATVLDQVRLLTDDDESRRVSTAATSLLTELIPEQDCLAFHYDQGCAAMDAGRWDKAIEHLTAVTEIDPNYRDVAAKLEQAQADRSLAGLRAKLARLAQAQRWRDVVTVWDRIRKIDPTAADPDGSVSMAPRAAGSARGGGRGRGRPRATPRTPRDRQRTHAGLPGGYRMAGVGEPYRGGR